MGKKLTQEGFVADCIAEHNNFYDYSLTRYVNSRGKIEIICPIHGVFTQKAEAHKSGNGCPACGEILKGTGSKPTTDHAGFIEDSILLHNHLYSYGNVNYVNRGTKVSITCKKHGDFLQTPKDHLTGRGCHCCAKEHRNDGRKHTTESCIERCKEVQDVVYDYSKAIYLGDKVPMKIGCSIHGDFLQVPSNHLQGQGCPHCKKTGYNTSKAGYLYVLTNKNVTKVGITNRLPATRAKEVFKSGGPCFSVHSHIYSVDGSVPRQIELATHKWLEERHNRVSEVFDGSTECFLDVNLEELLTFITPLAAQTEANNRPTN